MMRTRTMTRARLLLAVFLTGLFGTIALAQPTAARPDRGTPHVRAYSVSDLENISMTTGNVNLSIPLASLPPVAGGKLSFTLRAVYNSKLWDVTRSERRTPAIGYSTFMVDTPQLGNGGGWGIAAGYSIDIRDATGDVNYYRPQQHEDAFEWQRLRARLFRVVLTAPDGAEHELRPTDHANSYGGERPYLRNYYYDTPDTVNAAMRYHSFDGTYLYAVIEPLASAGDTRWTLFMPDGTRVVQYKNGIQRIRDTNNNSIKIYSTDEATYVQDEQTGREIKYASDWANNVDRASYRTVGGGWATVEIRWGWTRVLGKVYDVEDWNSLGGEFGTGDFCRRQEQLTNIDVRVIREIILPATEPNTPGKKFTFSYDSDRTVTARTEHVRWTCDSQPTTFERTASLGTGALNRMVTPSGAVVNYTYEYSNPITSPHYFMEADEITLDHITSKSVTHDGVTDNWSYSIGLVSSSVSNPDGTSSAEVFYPHDPTWGTFFAQTAEKSGLVYRSTSGNVMVERHWTLMPFAGANTTPTGATAATSVNFNPIVDAEYTSLMEPDGGGRSVAVKMSAKTFRYDYNGNLLQTTEYDWFDPSLVQRDNLGIPTGVPAHDSVKVLRTTVNTFHNSATTADSPNVYAKRAWGTYAPVTTNAVQETTVGSSRVRLSYDGLAYGATPTAGNVTQLSSFDDRGDADPSNDRWVNTSLTYDSFGNRKTATDANGNVTEFFYEDTTHALPTKVLVDPLNGTGPQTSFTTYDFWTGLVTSQTDANGHTATLDYTNQLTGAVDPFNRPGVAAGPAVVINGAPQRRKVFTFYEDSARRVRVEADFKAEGDRLLKSRETRDELGRVVLSEGSEDGSTYSISSRTIYEEAGRIVFSSNPTRDDGAATDGWTRKTLDNSGRVTEVATFSGAARPPSIGTNSNWTGSIRTTYYADEMTVTDQASRKKKSVTDADGRLVRIYEAPAESGYNYLTTYEYDALGNLTKVIQGEESRGPVQVRRFVYSSLSALISASNPESGTVSFSYDAVGNLLAKTDARGATTTHTYDGLNRLTRRSYSERSPGVPWAPEVVYTYDTASNGKGRPASVSTNSSSYTFLGYDEVGRVLGSAQRTALGAELSPADPTYTVSYVYDLAGNLTSQSYPSGKIIQTEYDSAGRLAGVRNGPAGAYYVGGASSNASNRVKYTAHGAPESLRLGNGLWEHNFFNGRLQAVRLALGTMPGDSSLLRLDNTYGTSDNNGNPRSQTITAGGIALTQTYSYDALNRLLSARETRVSDGWQTWKQSYLYANYAGQNSQFSNRRVDADNSTGNVLPTINPETDPANNRVAGGQGYAYDAAGNVNADPQHSYTYDAENRLTGSGGGMAVAYTYDGEGRRVKKDAGGVTTVFVYNAMGQLVAEYSNQTSAGAGTSYLTQDTLGSTRVVTGAGGAVRSRHDYLPFGEEIHPQLVASGRDLVPGYGSGDVGQKFTGYERGKETGLDYAQARYYASAQGRFTSPDPMYYQAAMAIDPQRFNLYAYARNNPLKWVDPDGERLFLRGDTDWLQTNVLYEMAGGREQFDRYFEIRNGEVVLREGVDTSNANAGVRELAGYVTATQNYLYYAGTNGEDAATLFQGMRDRRNRLTTAGRNLVDEFEGNNDERRGGSVIGTTGRGSSFQPANLANGEPVFAVIAYNTSAVFTQTGVDVQYQESLGRFSVPLEVDVQTEGAGQVIRPVSFFIHETAENRRFAQIGASNDNYRRAHAHAITREATIRRALGITGGFSGGVVQRRVPRQEQ